MPMEQEPNLENTKPNNSNTTTGIPTNPSGLGGNPNQPKVLSLAIKDLKVLYTAYMPFVINGGLFIPTKKSFNMGDSLPLLLSFMEESNKYSVLCKVIWITPGNSTNRVPGIGVQFTGSNAMEISNKIKGLLSNMQSNEITNTM